MVFSPLQILERLSCEKVIRLILHRTMGGNYRCTDNILIIIMISNNNNTFLMTRAASKQNNMLRETDRSVSGNV